MEYGVGERFCLSEVVLHRRCFATTEVDPPWLAGSGLCLVTTHTRGKRGSFRGTITFS